MEMNYAAPTAADASLPTVEETPQKGLGKAGLVFALFALIAAYLYTCIFPAGSSPLGFFVLAVSLYAATFVFALIKGARPTVHTLLAVIFGIVMALYYLLNGESDLYYTVDLFPAFLLSLPCYAYFVVSLFGNHSRSFGGRFILDIAKGVAYAFMSFIRFFVDIFTFGGEKKGGKKIGLLLLGIAVALIFVLIVGSLLSYDANFKKMLPEINIDTIGETILKLTFAIPIAALIYSLFSSSYEKKLPLLSTEATAEKVENGMKFLPAVIAVIPAAALLVLYLMFFISQWAYYMSAFTHKLPEGYSFAEYAREGFFQLCAVACINGILVAVLRCLTKRRTKAECVACDVLTILLAISTLVLIATALSKMLLYIDAYDLTRDRLVVTLILVFLAIAFIAVILAALIKKMKATPVIIVTAAVFVLVYALCRPGRLIAKYNVDAYLNGKHENIDVMYLQNEIGYAAVPELLRLYEGTDDSELREKTDDSLDFIATKLRVYRGMEEYNKWYRMSIPRSQADKLLSDRIEKQLNG